MDAMGQADVVRAGGQKPFVHAMVAKIAFLGDAPGHIKGNGFVGAFIHTSSAPCAPFKVHHNDAVLTLVNCLLRTGLGTGRSLAVPADIDVVDEPEFPIPFSGTVFLHADEGNAVSAIHFLLARNFAGSASPAQFVIDVQYVLLHARTPYEIGQGRFHFFSG
jgi:hypothetical protein